MTRRVYYTCWVVSYLTWIAGLSAGAAPCIRLAGVVRDYASHQPLMAQLYLKTSTGRTNLGSSTNEGQFRVDITCSSVALVIEKSGYRPQLLSLNTAMLATQKEPVWVIIPLIAVDEEGSERPYMQTEQTYFVQANTGGKTKTQVLHNVFTISDALIGKILPAQACFVFTRTGQKRCLTADASGKVSIDFTETDIVALEVTASGYRTYEGNFRVDQLDDRQLQHTIKLTRELTLLSIRLGSGAGSCELQPVAGAVKPTVPEPVPGETNVVAASDLLPQSYKLVIFDRQHVMREQRTITLRSGLNVAEAIIFEVVAPVVVPPLIAKPVVATPVITKPVEATIAAFDRLDSLPMLYFEQSDYKLKPASETTLLQVAAYLKQHPTVKIQLTGHTDKEGDEHLNRSLAEFRAKKVSSFLYWQGIPDNRMEISGVGSQFPIAPSDTEENKAKNRRVAMKFIVSQTR